MVLLQTVVILLLTCCKVLSPEFLEKTTPFILRSPKLPLPVMAKLMEVGHEKSARLQKLIYISTKRYCLWPTGEGRQLLAQIGESSTC